MFYQTITFLLFLLLIGVDDGLAESNPEMPVLHIAGWDVYADPANRNKTIGYESFEKQFGYQIEFKPLSNLDQIINYAETAENVDILIISNEGIEILHRMNIVSPIVLDKVPYYQELHPNLRYSKWSQLKGDIVAIPWAWGPTGLLYDTDKVPKPNSWNILWDPKYKNQITLWDDVSMIWTTALALGYTNVYNLTKGQLKHIKTKLLELNHQVHDYYRGEPEEIALLSSGKAIISNSWFDPSARLTRHNKNFKW